MPAEICNDCGLPIELCVCEDIEKSESPEVTIRLEEAGFADKKMTVVAGLTEHDANELDSELKSSLGTGGTLKQVQQPDGSTELELHLQGDQTERDQLTSILEDNGYDVVYDIE